MITESFPWLNRIRTILQRDSSLVLLLSVILLILFLIHGIGTCRDDVLVFHRYASYMMAGQVPYLDFEVEFPPGAIVTYLIPALATTDLEGYCTVFAAFMTLCTLGTAYVGLRICDRTGVDKIAFAVLYIILVSTFYCHLVEKFDMAPVFLTALAILLHMSGKQKLAYCASP